jgi:hypothetical protein
MNKRLQMVLVLVVVTSLFGSVSIDKANALENSPNIFSQQTPTVTTVPMTVECGKLSAKVLAEAKKRNLCPSPNSGEIVPYNIVTGNCGTAYLFASNMGAGIVQFNMGAASTQGPIATVSYSTNWINWTNGRGGNVSGIDYPLKSTWTRTRIASTGAGYVTATMSGQVTLVWGLICGLMNPSTTVSVTN